VAILVANTTPNNTFSYWMNRTNEVATAMSVYALTTDSNGNYTMAVGNSQITGTFSANALVSTYTLNVGNPTYNVSVNATSLSIQNPTSSLVINAPSSAVSSNGQYWLNANGQYGYIPFYYGILNIYAAGSAATVDSFSMTAYRTAKYLVSVWDNNANNRYASEILVAHDGTVPYIVEYSGITTNTSGPIGTFSVTYAGVLAELQLTPVSSNVTVRYYRTAV
jgi:hypothetical protein